MAKTEITLICPHCGRKHPGLELSPGTLSVVCDKCRAPDPQSKSNRKPNTKPTSKPAGKKD